MTEPGLFQVLSSRRMCRDFLDEPLAADELERVLAAAFRGPAAGNTAALDLVVLEGTDTERYWSITLPPRRRAAFRWPGVLRAPVLVLPYVDPGAYVARYAEADKVASGLGESQAAWPVPYWFVDGGAAIMAMLLAAEAIDRGALLFGQFEHEAAVAESLGVPPGRRALGTLALGHASDGGRAPSASARRGRPALQERLHRGGWA